MLSATVQTISLIEQLLSLSAADTTTATAAYTVPWTPQDAALLALLENELGIHAHESASTVGAEQQW